MVKLSCVTPDGQVTIPRSIMKTLGINNGNDILIEVENGRLILKKIEIAYEDNCEDLIYKVG
ncbi:MAG: AbrB/MazE/SpoVT family DNA-binding domain-containing protein [Peptococcaceae bacterium]|nr:AbrB/MazE/SpoVT family DNA-binding domain-containing protein [Peptococcaceae bacterium]